MENKEDLLKKLNSCEPDLLAEAIAEIKKNGDISIVSSLLDILASKPDNYTTAALISLLADIKENDIKEVITRRIKANPDTEQKSLLIRICWESSLDYSDYLDLFADIMLHDDFNVAFEASTAIENMLHNITQEKRCQLIKTLSAFKNPDEKRKFLIDELLNSISLTEEEEKTEG